MGGDRAFRPHAFKIRNLKSTPPVWAGTFFPGDCPYTTSPLNPPRPCGRGRRHMCREYLHSHLKSTPPVWAGTGSMIFLHSIEVLKSTPPVWAGTCRFMYIRGVKFLKSTPPVWAGTSMELKELTTRTFLKSTPPVWAGTFFRQVLFAVSVLKSTPPVWAGTSLDGFLFCVSTSLNPPRPCGRGPCWISISISPTRSLNPPRPCGRGPRRRQSRTNKANLKSTPPVWAGTARKKEDVIPLSP